MKTYSDISREYSQFVGRALLAATVALLVGVLARELRADEVCYERAERDYVKQVKPRKRIHRTDLGCGNSFACVFKNAPSTRRVLQVYLGRKLPNRVLFGNLGWASKNVATARSRNSARIRLSRSLRARIRNAIELARGVELQSLITSPWLIWGDRDFHDRLSAEVNCINRRKGFQFEDSFNELAKIPKKAWADQRRSQGWFDNDCGFESKCAEEGLVNEN